MKLGSFRESSHPRVAFNSQICHQIESNSLEPQFPLLQDQNITSSQIGIDDALMMTCSPAPPGHSINGTHIIIIIVKCYHLCPTAFVDKFPFRRPTPQTRDLEEHWGEKSSGLLHGL